MKHFASILLLLGLVACTTAPPAPKSDWLYIGNDPAGTQNILMASATPVPENGVLTTTFRFQYTAPHTLTSAKGKSLYYIEQREQVSVDCINQTQQILHKQYFNVDGKQLPSAAASAPGALQRVIPGGLDDIVYQAVCGRAVGWTRIGNSGNQTIYILGKSAGHSINTQTQAWFKTEYAGNQNLVAAPSMHQISYATKVSTLSVDCSNYQILVSNEVYYDDAGHKVFDIQPQGVDANFTATNSSVQGLMYRAACGHATELRYLGLGPHHNQKIYLRGQPVLNQDGTASANYRIYYLQPGTLTTGPVIHTVSYDQRTVELEADCAALTIRVQGEAYLDHTGKAVFTITPPAGGEPAVAVSPGSLSEMLWQNACRDAG